jgi:hypothetical protein
MMKLLRILALIGAACLAPAAGAHMMEAGHGSVRLVGDSAYVVVAVPVAAFRGADDNKDGLLDREEVSAHRAELSAQVSALLVLEHGGKPGTVLFEDLLLSHASEEGAKGEAHLVVMRRYQWPQALTSLHVKVGLFVIPALAADQLKLRVIEGERTEVAIFKGALAQHTFFNRAGAP